MERQSTDPRDDGGAPLAEDAILQFAIVCCAVTMMIVLAVGYAAS